MLRQDPVECLISFICSSNNHITRITQVSALHAAQVPLTTDPPQVTSPCPRPSPSAALLSRHH